MKAEPERCRPMTLKRALIRVLDRPGGRCLLAAGSSWWARRTTGRALRILHEDGLWIRALDDRIFEVDKNGFPYTSRILRLSPGIMERAAGAAKDFWFHVYRPSAGDVIVDVGAGNGSDTVVFSRAVGDRGRVIAIEAHPLTFRRLEKACRLHGLRNVGCLNCAAVGTEAVVYIEDRRMDEENTVVESRTSTHARPVAGMTLAEICRRRSLERIDLLKVNIEGGEVAALNGAESILDRVRHIAVACHDFRAADEAQERFATRARVIEILERHRFRIVERRDDPRRFVRDHVHGLRASGARHLSQPVRRGAQAGPGVVLR